MKGISRRRFLAASLAGGAAATVTISKSALGAEGFQGYPNRMGVLVDLTRCVGCRTCEAACNKEQNLPAPKVPFNDMSVYDWRSEEGQQRRTDENHYTVVDRYQPAGVNHPLYRKVQCNHCNEPACLTACFVHAYTKTKEGAVIYNSKVCVGCRTCMVACPFRIPTFAYSSATDPVIKKCVFCYDTRLKYGKPPACVEACPQQALTFGHRKDLIKIGHDRIRANPDKYVDHIYGEKEIGGTSWMYLSSVPFSQMGFDTTLGKEPIIGHVQDFLATVPVVLTVWPALFTGFHLLAKREKEHQEEDPSLTAQEDSKK